MNTQMTSGSWITTWWSSLRFHFFWIVLLVSSTAINAGTVAYQGEPIAIPLSDAELANYSVMVNGQDVTVFVSEVDGGILFNHPFPEKATVFELKVMSSDQQQAYFQQTYRRTLTDQNYDPYAVVADGQSTSVCSLTPHAEEIAEPQPDFQTTIENTNGYYYQKSATTNLIINDNACVYLTAGDTELSTSNSLVNPGIHARGMLLGFKSLNERLRLELGQVQGNDFSTSTSGVIDKTTVSNQTGAQAELQLFNSAAISWKLQGSFLGIERPASIGFGSAASSLNESNEVWGMGTRLSAFGDRLHMNLTWAQSSYEAPHGQFDMGLSNVNYVGDESDLYAFADDEFHSDDSSSTLRTRGTAWRHSLKWGTNPDQSEYLIETSNQFNVEIAAERTSSAYQSLQSDSIADQRVWSARASMNKGPISIEVGSSRSRNNVSDLESVPTIRNISHTASFDLDLYDFKNGTQEYFIQDVEYDHLNNQEQFNASSVSIDDSYSEENHVEYVDDLDEIHMPVATKSSPRWRSLIPSSIGISAQFNDVDIQSGNTNSEVTIFGYLDFNSQNNRSITLSSTWEGWQSNTMLDISAIDLSSAEQTEQGFAQSEVYYGLSHDVTLDSWSLGGRVGFSRMNNADFGLRSATRQGDIGINGSYTTRAGVVLSASIDSTTGLSRYLGIGESESSEFRALGISADFGHWLKRRLNLPGFPFLTANWQRSYTDIDSDWYSDKSISDFVSVNAEVTF